MWLETQMVCNLHFPTETTSEFIIWNGWAFQEKKPYQFPGRMKTLLTIARPWGVNPRPPAYPDFKEPHTIGRRWTSGRTPEHFVLGCTCIHFITAVEHHHAGEAIIMLLGNYENFANVVAENIIKTRCIRIKWSVVYHLQSILNS